MSKKSREHYSKRVTHGDGERNSRLSVQYHEERNKLDWTCAPYTYAQQMQKITSAEHINDFRTIGRRRRRRHINVGAI